MTHRVAAQALFQNTIGDVLRKIRNASTSEEEQEAIAKAMSDIKDEISSPVVTVKVVAIQKIMYFNMMGFESSFAFFPIVEVMSSRTFLQKRVAYTAASLCFREDADIIPLTTGLLIRDLQSPNANEQSLALGFLSSVCTPELARDVIAYVVELLDVSYPSRIRKQSVVCLYRVFLEYPEALKSVYVKLKEKIDDNSEGKDSDSGVRGTVVCVMCELARRMPVTYLGLAIPFYSLLSTIEGNWALIKIIKVFSYFVPHEPRLVKKLAGAIKNLLESTKAISVQYECYLAIMSTDLVTLPALASLAVEGIQRFLSDQDQNLRFMGLEAVATLATRHPTVALPLRKLALKCLRDRDAAIRRKAALILREVTPSKYLVATVMEMLSLCSSKSEEGSAVRDWSWANTVVLRVIEMTRREDYAHLKDFEWYFSVLVDLYRLPAEPFLHGQRIADEIMTILLRVSSVRSFAVTVLANIFLEDDTPWRDPPVRSSTSQQLPSTAAATNAATASTRWCVLSTASFACGEFCSELPLNMLKPLCEIFLHPDLSRFPSPLQCSCLWAVWKLVSYRKAQEEGVGEEQRALLRPLFIPFVESTSFEVAEAAAIVRYLCCEATEPPPASHLSSLEESCGEDGSPRGVDWSMICPGLLDLLPLSDSEEEDEDEDRDVGAIYGDGVEDLLSTTKHRSEGTRNTAYYLLDDADGEGGAAKRKPYGAKGSHSSLDHYSPPTSLAQQLLSSRKELRLHNIRQLPGNHSEEDKSEEEVDEVTRRLQLVDVRTALTPQEAIPGLPYRGGANVSSKRRAHEKAIGDSPQEEWVTVLQKDGLRLRLKFVKARFVKTPKKTTRSSAPPGAVQFYYTAEVLLLPAGTHTSSGAMKRLTLSLDSESCEASGFTGVQLSSSSPSSSQEESGASSCSVLLSERLKMSTVTSIPLVVTVACLPSSLTQSSVHCVLSGRPHRSTTDWAAALSFSVPLSHWVDHHRDRPLSPDAFHGALSSLSSDSISEEVLEGFVPCSSSDLLMAVPLMQVELCLQAVEVYADAIALYLPAMIPRERHSEEDDGVLPWASSAFVLITSKQDSAGVLVSVRSQCSVLGEAVIEEIVRLIVAAAQ